MKTYGDWFSGFGGMTIGAMGAGFTPIFACEYDSEIAAVYKANLGDHVVVADLLTLDNGMTHPKFPRSKNARKRRLQDMQGDWFRRVLARGGRHGEFVFTSPQFPSVSWKHDSPPCPEFSVAKAGGEEGAREIALAIKCCEYLMYARPDFYSLENVWGYTRSESLQLILDTLKGLGYGVDYWHLNAADYGVAQTRKRLILMAQRNGRRPARPAATHYDNSRDGFAGSLFFKPWVSWLEAVADIVHSFPDSQFADWQLARMPSELSEMTLLNHRNLARNATVLQKEKPAFTVSNFDRASHTSAFLVGDQRSHGGELVMCRNGGSPALVTDTRPASKIRAFISNGVCNTYATGVACCSHVEPVFTVTANIAKAMPRAFLAPVHGAGSVGFDETKPAQTIAACHGAGKYRALIADSGNSQSNVKRECGRAAPKNGRVVQLTVRALARFQSFPNWYQFPSWGAEKAMAYWAKYFINGVQPDELDVFMLEHIVTNRTLSCRGIGNAVPPLLATAVGKAWV